MTEIIDAYCMRHKASMHVHLYMNIYIHMDDTLTCIHTYTYTHIHIYINNMYNKAQQIAGRMYYIFRVYIASQLCWLKPEIPLMYWFCKSQPQNATEGVIARGCRAWPNIIKHVWFLFRSLGVIGHYVSRTIQWMKLPMHYRTVNEQNGRCMAQFL